MSSAFTNPSSGKIDQQRKILEELERRKKNINHSTTTSNISTTTNSTTEGAQVSNNQQKAAMKAALESSYGYFIPQDSSFGNFILPVIPRLPNPNANNEKQ